MSIDTVSIHGKEHPTYAGVLSKAHDDGLKSIETTLVQAPTKDNSYMAIVHARVTTKRGVFDGIGDATPKNVNSMIAPHIVRMAETRAKGRALRDALNITEALAEELGGSTTGPVTPENDVMERHMSSGQECKKCGAKMVKNPKTGKWFCEKKCWLNQDQAAAPSQTNDYDASLENIADEVPF